MEFDYFYGPEDAEQYQFYRIPKLLITSDQFKDVSVEAKLLYGLMLDRLSLSIKNGWFDALNRAYIIYTIEDVSEDMHCGRPYLFEDDIYANPVPDPDYPDYDIPTEALSDTRFARMIQEAEKYLGYPYVWGGSSPSTSFDCSGFVCWVINHCGNGWNYGRTTAEGLRQRLTIIPPSEAKPGDIIFFQGTYNTYGASHVAIYVGNGMMIHCGNPIQYASINTSYWQAHFYCFGRLP